MTAKEILKWAIVESINCEKLLTIDVPEPGDSEWQQNENWWVWTVGAAPPNDIPAGEYILYWEHDIPDGICDYEIETFDGLIHLIRLEQ